MRVLGCLIVGALGAPAASFAPSRCGRCHAIRWARSPKHPVSSCKDETSVSRPRRHVEVTGVTYRRRREKLQLHSTRGDQDGKPSSTQPPALSFSTSDTAEADQTALDDARSLASEQQSLRITASSLFPLALLNGVTILWGTQHAVIKLILQEDLSPGVTNFARFSLAAVLFSPWTPGLLRDAPRLPFAPDPGDDSIATAVNDRGAEWESGIATETWRAGAELGIWMFLGFAFQAIGLGFTTASRSAFLLYLNVKLVPFFAFVLEGRKISTATWIGAFLAFAGTVLLSSDGTPPNVGDLWSILAAATSAMFILRLEKYSNTCDASRLNSANLWITAGLCGLWAGWELFSGRSDATAAFEGVKSQGALIAYLAVVTTALTNWMQALGQRSVPAERAAVIYAMDPVYAAGFAYLLLGETLGPTGIVGAGIITGAALWSQRQEAPDGANTEAKDD